MAAVAAKPLEEPSELTEAPKVTENEVEAAVEAAVMNTLETPEMHTLARRKLMSASVAKQRFKRAAMEAAYDISNEFHGPYLSRMLMSDLGRNLMDANHPSSTFETIKRGFLFHLNSTGHYLVIREHLRHAITNVIQQCGLVLRPSGFKNHREFQSFLHDMYIFLADELHEALNESNSSEMKNRGSNGARWLGRSNFDESVTCLRKLHHFAEEAFVEKDFENCHRLHLLRVCADSERAELWTDFAIMWCARGDDRMAEIALREALKLNPKHVHALLLAGIIAARNKDERAIGFIGQALKLYPLSPEIMVLLAIAHRKLGNEARSKYFFLKARLLHLMLTGKDTSRAEADFKNFRFPDALPPAHHDRPSTESEVAEERPRKRSGSAAKGDSKSRRSRSSSEGRREAKGDTPVPPPPNTTKSTTATPRDGGDGGSVRSNQIGAGNKSRRKTKANVNKVGDGESSSKKSDDETKTVKGRKGNKKSPERKKNTNDPVIDMVKDDNPLLAARTSIAASNALPKKSNSAAKLAYDFPIEINEETSNQINLPALMPSVIFTWDVTQPFGNSDTDQTMPPKTSIHFESTIRNIGSFDLADSKEFESEVIQSFDKFLQSKIVTPEVSVVNIESGGRGKGRGHSPSRLKKDTVMTTSTKSTAESKPVGKTPRSGKKYSLKSTANNISGSMDDLSEQSQVVVQDDGVEENPNSGKKGPLTSSLRKVWTRRFGSEYIWAAQLFLRYHAHDFMDAALARELFFTESRSVPFLYLLTQSMNLRKREKAAKALTEELMGKPEFQKNPYVWEQKGHAHFGLTEMDNAIQCYEKAMEYAEPNQNLQVVYLRYGNLNFENLKLTKSVLLKGTSLFPSLSLWIALGKLCYQNGQYSEAEAAFTHANRMDNTNPVTWGYLALVNLAQENQTLAEQCFKWAVRFGLKSGPIWDEIRALQNKFGFGDPSFPRVPNCIPHQYYLKRLGRQNLLEVYREALEAPETYFGNRSIVRLDETAREAELKRLLTKLQQSKSQQKLAETEEDETVSDLEHEEEARPSSVRSAGNKGDVDLPKRPSQLFRGGSKSPKRRSTGQVPKAKSKPHKKGAKA